MGGAKVRVKSRRTRRLDVVAWVVIGVAVLVGLFILVGVAWFAWDSDKRVRKFAHSTDLIPGKPARAPEEWARANTPEALLHRRIRYAIADVHQNPAIPRDESLVAARDRLDDAVFDLDDKLIAAASLTGDEHDAAIDHVETAIHALEVLPTRLWEAPKEQQLEDLEATTSALRR